MGRLGASLGSAIFFVLAPGTVAGLVPWWITEWHLRPASGNVALLLLRWAGLALILVGLMPLVASFARFAWQGLGTLAPIVPPTRIVVGGFYAHVRNPMYVAVLVILLGEAMLFADDRLLLWAAAFWLLTHLFVLLYEEPALARAFGGDYATYRTNVPRWIPRLRPWKPPAE